MIGTTSYKVCLLAAVPLALLAVGCRAHPVSLAVMLIGEAVDDADVENKAAELVGKEVSLANLMLGEQLEALDDTGRHGRAMFVYPVKGDMLNSSRYVVEASNGTVVALTKTKQNIDGAEDVIKAVDLKTRVIGETPAGCRTRGDLGRPILVLRDRADGTLVRVYDVRNWTNLRGARYCVLRFDHNDRCEQVNLVGVSASTKSNPARG
jgi:hypothetical protein